MKADIKVKYLQFLNKKSQKSNAGFTLIELLVVIIIIGILSAIALPSFLSQSAKARASEARTNVGALNRSQQAYYLEKQAFIDDSAGAGTGITALGIGINNSANYEYELVAGATGNLKVAVINKAKSLSKDLKGHIGGVFSTPENQTPSILCQAKAPALETATPMDEPALNGGTPAIPECKGNTEAVGG